MKYTALVNSILSIAMDQLADARDAALLDVRAGTAIDKADAENAAESARLARQALLGSLDQVVVTERITHEQEVIIRRGGLFDVQPDMMAMEEW